MPARRERAGRRARRAGRSDPEQGDRRPAAERCVWLEHVVRAAPHGGAAHTDDSSGQPEREARRRCGRHRRGCGPRLTTATAVNAHSQAVPASARPTCIPPTWWTLEMLQRIHSGHEASHVRPGRKEVEHGLLADQDGDREVHERQSRKAAARCRRRSASRRGRGGRPSTPRLSSSDRGRSAGGRAPAGSGGRACGARLSARPVAAGAARAFRLPARSAGCGSQVLRGCLVGRSCIPPTTPVSLASYSRAQGPAAARRSARIAAARVLAPGSARFCAFFFLRMSRRARLHGAAGARGAGCGGRRATGDSLGQPLAASNWRARIIGTTPLWRLVHKPGDRCIRHAPAARRFLAPRPACFALNRQ